MKRSAGLDTPAWAHDGVLGGVFGRWNARWLVGFVYMGVCCARLYGYDGCDEDMIFLGGGEGVGESHRAKSYSVKQERLIISSILFLPILQILQILQLLFASIPNQHLQLFQEFQTHKINCSLELSNQNIFLLLKR